MNAATAKQQFSRINLSALPGDLQEELVRFKQESSNFASGIPEETQIYQNWTELYDIIQSAFPAAIQQVDAPSNKPIKASTKKGATTKTPRVKAEKIPKPSKRIEAQKAKLEEIKSQVEKYKKQLKASDQVKAQIAKLAQQEYAKISQLGSTKLEADIQKAEIQRKLYKRFLTTDKQKFKSITKKTVGTLGLGKPKAAGKATKKKSIFEHLFG